MPSQVIMRLRVVCAKRKWIVTCMHHSFFVQVCESSIWIRILMGTRKCEIVSICGRFTMGHTYGYYVGKEGRKCVISLKA